MTEFADRWSRWLLHDRFGGDDLQGTYHLPLRASRTRQEETLVPIAPVSEWNYQKPGTG
jgi:hypothetical protein